MRRNNFLITIVVAVITFTTLSAFVHRPWDWHRGWRHRHCYYDSRYHDGEQHNAIRDSTNNNY